MRYPLAMTAAVVLLGSVSISGCGKDNGCESATQQMSQELKAVCAEPQFANTPFCNCCVPSGFYAIDDTCTCKPLVLDADFCFFDDTDAGRPQIRSALVYAASVCQDRTVKLPYGLTGGANACPSGAVDGSAEATSLNATFAPY